MKRILLLISLISLTFTQELKVEGDLNVTGSIQNQTIDSLLQVIQDLQSQITLLQSSGGVETRMFDFDFDLSIESSGNTNNYSIFEIISEEISYGIIDVVDFNVINTDCNEYQIYIQLNGSEIFVNEKTIFYYHNDPYIQIDSYSNIMNTLYDNFRLIGYGQSCNMEGTITFLITSNFSSESSTQQSQTTSKQSK